MPSRRLLVLAGSLTALPALSLLPLLVLAVNICPPSIIGGRHATRELAFSSLFAPLKPTQV